MNQPSFNVPQIRVQKPTTLSNTRGAPGAKSAQTESARAKTPKIKIAKLIAPIHGADLKTDAPVKRVEKKATRTVKGAKNPQKLVKSIPQHLYRADQAQDQQAHREDLPKHSQLMHPMHQSEKLLSKQCSSFFDAIHEHLEHTTQSSSRSLKVFEALRDQITHSVNEGMNSCIHNSEAFFKCNDLNDLIDLQQKLMEKTTTRMTHEFTKMTEIVMNYATESMHPTMHPMASVMMGMCTRRHQ